MATASAASGGAAGTPVKLGGRLAWTALILIALTQAVSMIDRQVMAILAPRIKEALQIGDAEVGMLYGTVFAVFYALFSLPLGRIADGWVRTRLLSISIFAWSVLTGLAGFAQSFAFLAATRLGVGVGEASVLPAGLSMLTDMFPRERRGLVTASIGAAIALGLGGAVWLGGTVADGWDKAYAGGDAPLGLAGWQAAFVVAAIPGIILGVLLLFLPEPVRGAADGIAPPPDPHPFRGAGSVLMEILPVLAWISFARMRAPTRMWIVNVVGLALIAAAAILLTRYTEALRPSPVVALKLGPIALGGNALQWTIAGFGSYVLLCWGQARSLRDRPVQALFFRTPALNAIIGLAILQMIINYGVMGWTPTYLVREYDQSLARVGAIFGPLSAAIGIVGPLIAGPLSDLFKGRNPSGRLYLLAAVMTLSPLTAMWTYAATDITSFYIRFVIFSLVLTMWMPPVYASMMDLVLPRMRGTMMAYYTLITTILGLGTGPYLVGLISDVTGDLGFAIMCTFFGSPVIVLLTLYAAIRLPKDEAAVVERARAAGEPV